MGPGTFQWTEDHLVGPNFYLKIDNQVYLPLTVAYFVIVFFFFVLLLVEEETEKYEIVPVLLLPFTDTVETVYGLIIRCFTAL